MAKQRINTNCLNGYKCPSCQSPGPLLMDTKCVMNWDDDGTDAGGKYAQRMEIVLDGFTRCVECNHVAKTSEFDMEQRYVNRGGNECPYCGAEEEHLEGGEIHRGNHLAWADSGCNKCGAEWQDEYTLTGLGNFPDVDFVVTHNEEVVDA